MKAFVISCAIGLAAGLFGGLVGLGGGLVMIPLLVGILKLRQHEAHGTSLVGLVFTGISGATTYALNGAVDLMAALLLAATAIATAQAGAKYANTLSEWRLKKLFGILLIFCAILLVLKPYLPARADVAQNSMQVILFLLIGLFAGFISGLLGVGGGIVMVPAMILFGGLTQHIAQGTSLLVMIPVGSMGAVIHWRSGNVAKKYLSGLLPGILLGTFLGGSFANMLPEAPLRLIFVLLTIIIGVRYIQAPAP